MWGWPTRHATLRTRCQAEAGPTTCSGRRLSARTTCPSPFYKNKQPRRAGGRRGKRACKQILSTEAGLDLCGLRSGDGGYRDTEPAEHVLLAAHVIVEHLEVEVRGERRDLAASTGRKRHDPRELHKCKRCCTELDVQRKSLVPSGRLFMEANACLFGWAAPFDLTSDKDIEQFATSCVHNAA